MIVSALLVLPLFAPKHPDQNVPAIYRGFASNHTVESIAAEAAFIGYADYEFFSTGNLQKVHTQTMRITPTKALRGSMKQIVVKREVMANGVFPPGKIDKVIIALDKNNQVLYKKEVSNPKDQSRLHWFHKGTWITSEKEFLSALSASEKMLAKDPSKGLLSLEFNLIKMPTGKQANIPSSQQKFFVPYNNKLLSNLPKWKKEPFNYVNAIRVESAPVEQRSLDVLQGLLSSQISCRYRQGQTVVYRYVLRAFAVKELAERGVNVGNIPSFQEIRYDPAEATLVYTTTKLPRSDDYFPKAKQLVFSNSPNAIKWINRKRFPKLEEVWLIDSNYPTSLNLSLFTTLPTVHTLGIRPEELTEYNLRFLKTMVQLRTLHLSKSEALPAVQAKLSKVRPDIKIVTENAATFGKAVTTSVNFGEIPEQRCGFQLDSRYPNFR